MRTFIAIEIPDQLKRQLGQTIERLRAEVGTDDIKWVRSRAIHLTLKFLGEISPETQSAIVDVMEQAAPKFNAASLTIEGFGCFPNTKRPRVLWLGVEDPDLMLHDLQTELEGGLARIGFEPDRRDYHPHLTLGRVRRGLSADNAQRIAEWAGSTEVGLLGSMEVDAVNLIRSDLQPSGAVYSRLHSVGFSQ